LDVTRSRHDVFTITLGDAAAAETEDWHPILDTYAHGVTLMRALDADVSPESWTWAANTHGIPRGTRPRPSWGQCAHASRFFLPWHRAYLAWFEGTIRRLTGQDDWALPYWDYSDPSRPETRTLPVEFTVKSRTVAGDASANPLFVPGRSPAALPLADVDVAAALSEVAFVKDLPTVGFGGADRDGYFGLVESLPHNYVHVDIGALMESPATAGQDPIFWLHHANVDRLWEVWRALPGSIGLTDPGAATALLVTQWESAVFWFGDERSPATYTMADVEDLNSEKMGYTYESIQVPADLARVIADARGDGRPGGGGIPLDDTGRGWEPVAASFNLDSGEERNLQFETGPRGVDDSPPAGLILELAGVRSTNPHTAYVVEVRSAPAAEAHVGGRVSTFGLAGTPDTEERNYLVDASSLLPDLLAEGWTGGQLTVRLVPDSERPDSDDVDRAIHVRQVTVYLQTP
jgi:tyrosinase